MIYVESMEILYSSIFSVTTVAKMWLILLRWLPTIDIDKSKKIIMNNLVICFWTDDDIIFQHVNATERNEKYAKTTVGHIKSSQLYKTLNDVVSGKKYEL